jgi:hypothetical protein
MVRPTPAANAGPVAQAAPGVYRHQTPRLERQRPFAGTEPCGEQPVGRVRRQHRLSPAAALGYLNMAIQPSLGIDYGSAVKILA